jgi:hypothetical protein
LPRETLAFPLGGTAPQGWLTENGPEEALLRSFGLVECAEPGYPARTRKNVVDADGTLLVGQCRRGGSALTARVTREAGKPLFHLAHVPNGIVPNERMEEFRYWLERYNIHILNVAGNRESSSPGIQEITRSFLLAALNRIKVI